MNKKPNRIQNKKYDNLNDNVQSKLNQEDIDILLEEYEEVTDNKDLRLMMEIRYYQIIKQGNIKQKLFRYGGKIINIDAGGKYIVLSNGKITWSVQLGNAIIYKKMSSDEIKKFYENELDIKDTEINGYRNTIIKLKNIIVELQEKNTKYKSDLIKVKQLLTKSGIIK